MINGYNSRGLDVDLSSGRLETFEIPDEVLVKFLGGRGLGVYYINKLLDPTADPLSADNILVISCGGLGGSMTPTGGRYSVTFKSPLTRTISSSNSGGFWGISLKRTGYDVLIIRGRAAVPVYLYISGTEARLESCPELWGERIPQLTDFMKEKYSQGARILGIGPAGENGVLFAAMMNDYNRAVGRGGPGAVMGSKNLKSVVVEGKKRFEAAEKEIYQSGIYQANKLLRSMPVTSKALPSLGTPGLLKLVYEHDMLPHNNFSDVSHRLEDIDKISGEYLRMNILKSIKGCFNCKIKCGRLTQVGQKSGEGPEFETLALMAANLSIYDIREVALANYVCNETGMDTISLGNTIGLGMELFEKGILSAKDTDGIELRFGQRGIIEQLAERTAARQGFADLIANGALRLSQSFQHDELAMVVKGLELPGYDPRATLLQALGYATSSRGGCHLKGGYAISLGFFGGSREVDRFLVDTVAGHSVNEQDSGCMDDSLGICRFSGYAFGENEISRIYSGYTGVDKSPDDLREDAQRIHNLERLFNIKAGFGKADDTLPARMFNEKIQIDGKMRAIDRSGQFEPMLQKYYEIRNWDAEGVPIESDEWTELKKK